MTSLKDISKTEWQQLDFTLEEYDRQGSLYPLDKIPLLRLVLSAVNANRDNLKYVPTYIKCGKQFQLLIKDVSIHEIHLDLTIKIATTPSRGLLL